MSRPTDLDGKVTVRWPDGSPVAVDGVPGRVVRHDVDDYWLIDLENRGYCTVRAHRLTPLARIVGTRTQVAAVLGVEELCESCGGENEPSLDDRGEPTGDRCTHCRDGYTRATAQFVPASPDNSLPVGVWIDVSSGDDPTGDPITGAVLLGEPIPVDAHAAPPMIYNHDDSILTYINADGLSTRITVPHLDRWPDAWGDGQLALPIHGRRTS